MFDFYNTSTQCTSTRIWNGIIRIMDSHNSAYESLRAKNSFIRIMDNVYIMYARIMDNVRVTNHTVKAQ